MIDELLGRIFHNQTTVFLIVSVILLVLAEIGYRLGRESRRRNRERAESHGGTVQGAVLGMLGLLLGFTFAMSVGRFDNRRSLVIDEANSIGTTWLRADFLPPPHGAEVRKLLLRYTEAKIRAFELDNDSSDMKSARTDMAGIHHALWTHASQAAEAKPNPLTASFISTLNETIDLDSSRNSATLNHVPGAVWLLLIVVAGCGAWSSGFVSGAGGFRSIFSQWIFPLLIGVVITLIADIDRPRRGMIGISNRPLVELLETIQSETP